VHSGARFGGLCPGSSKAKAVVAQPKHLPKSSHSVMVVVGNFQTNWEASQAGPDDSYRAQSGRDELDCSTAANDALLPLLNSATLKREQPLD